MLATVTGAALAGTAAMAWWMRSDAVEHGFELAEFHARAFDGQVTQTFDVIALVLSGLAADERTRGELTGVDQAFDEALRMAPFLRSVAVLGPDGRISVSSNPRNVGMAVSSEGLLPTGSGPTVPLRFGVPHVGRDFDDGRPMSETDRLEGDGPGFVPVWRDVVLADGLVVSVVAAVNGDHFLNAYVGGLDAVAGSVDLLRYDGVRLLTSGEAPMTWDGATGRGIVAWLMQAPHGRIVDLPGAERAMTAYRGSRRYPLLTVVRIDSRTALARWRDEAMTLLGVVLAALVGGGLLAAQYFRRLDAAAWERDLANSALKEGERRFRTLLSNLQGLAYRRRDDECGTVLFASEGVRSLLGIEPSDLVGASGGFDRLIHPDDRADYRERLRVCVQAQRAYDLQYRMQRADDRWLWVREQGVVVPGGDDAPCALEGYVVDVTARKQAADASRAAEARYRAALDSMIEAVRIVGFDWRYLYVNEAAAQQASRTRDEMFGKTVQELARGIESLPWFALLQRAMDLREPGAAEIEFRNAQGVTRWYEMRVGPVPEGIAVLSVDFTERHLFELTKQEARLELERKVAERTAALEIARHDAEQANRAKSAFLAAMSHEIRTPMNGVIGMIDVLLESRLKSSQVEAAKTVRDSAYALLGIVDAVLDFSKIETGQFEIEAEPMSVEAIVDGVCDTLDPVARQAGVLLTLFTDPAIPARLTGDAMRLRQVLVNLAGNAIKFSADPGRCGRVQVRAVSAGSGADHAHIEFSIVDNGIGMDEATVAKLFTPFTQADRSTTRRYGGTGLGLSISDRLVKLMGGTIEVCSAPGAGSVFKVRLGLPLACSLTGGDADVKPATADLKGIRCLVLEDLSGMADDLSVYLRHAGASVWQLPDTAALSDTLSALPPGLWISVVEDAVATLETLGAIAKRHPGTDLRFVALGVGTRRRPRVRGETIVCLDRNVMHRGVFLKAVALAADRATDGVHDAPAIDVETMPVPLTVDEARSQGKLLLIAEDNEINQRVVLRQLAMLGLRADVAEDGREAFERWRRGDYALLLTDLHMPRMDGYELSIAIRAAEAGRRRIPIIALTANALKGEAKHCREAGMDDYLTKPVQLAHLKATLERWLHDSSEPPPAADVGDAPIDIRVLVALVGSDPVIIDDILSDFHATAARAAEEIHAAVLSGRHHGTEAAAHKLKSAARAVGALPLGELCARLEERSRVGDDAAVRNLLIDFEAEKLRVDAALRIKQERRQ